MQLLAFLILLWLFWPVLVFLFWILVLAACYGLAMAYGMASLVLWVALGLVGGAIENAPALAWLVLALGLGNLLALAIVMISRKVFNFPATKPTATRARRSSPFRIPALERRNDG